MATLTEVKGANVTLKENVPVDKIDVTLNYGRMRVLYDSYTVDSADEFGTSGLIRLFTIPKGARLVDFEVSMPASGATGIFDIGWAESAEQDSSGTTLEAADANGIIAACDPGNAAIDRQKMLSTVDGYMKLFAGAVEVQADCTELTADSGGDTYEFMAWIVVD
jgi:hypothetical protein